MARERFRSADRLDRWFPWAFAAGVTAVFFTLSWLRAHTLDAGFDVAYFKQATWQLGHGHGGFLSVRGVHLFADHAYVLIYPLSWLSRVIPATPLLLGLQAAGLGFAVVPLYRISREMAGLARGPAAAVLAVYALHPAIQNANMFEFHPETVTAPLAFLGAVWFGHRNRGWATGACVALLLASREDFAFVVAGLGLVHLLSHRRRVGLAMLGAAAVSFVVTGALMARFPGAAEIRASRLLPFGTTPMEAAASLLQHPRLGWHQLTRPENFDVVVALLGPVLFLPLLTPIWTLPVAGLELLYLLSNVAPAHTIGFQYTLLPGLCVVLAAAVALGRYPMARRPAPDDTPPSGRRRLGLRLEHPIVVPLLGAALLFNVRLSASSVISHPWEWARRDAVDRARVAAARVPAPDAPVAASASILPLVAQRRAAYFFPAPFAAYEARLHPPDPIPLAERVASVRYLLIDTTTIAQEIHADMIPDVLGRLTTDGTFERLWEDHGVQVWRRTSGPS
jgi:predicted membrane protein DUF2079